MHRLLATCVLMTWMWYAPFLDPVFGSLHPCDSWLFHKTRNDIEYQRPKPMRAEKS